MFMDRHISHTAQQQQQQQQQQQPPRDSRD
jgi:hypothetical protein